MHHKRLTIESDLRGHKSADSRLRTRLRRAKEVREHGVPGSRRVDGPTAEAGGE